MVVPIHGAQPINHIPVALAGSPAPDAELTLHVARTLYDDGVLMMHSPSLHGLAPGPLAHINTVDADRIGIGDGNSVRLITSQGDGEFTANIDDGTPAGVVYVPYNQPGAAPLGTGTAVTVAVVSQ